MRTRSIADGRGTVTVRGARADVRLDRHYVGRVRRTRGVWRTTDESGFRSPVEAAEALVDASTISCGTPWRD